jgi:hypothetical protein
VSDATREAGTLELALEHGGRAVEVHDDVDRAGLAVPAAGEADLARRDHRAHGLVETRRRRRARGDRGGEDAGRERAGCVGLDRGRAGVRLGGDPVLVTRRSEGPESENDATEGKDRHDLPQHAGLRLQDSVRTA